MKRTLLAAIAAVLVAGCATKPSDAVEKAGDGPRYSAEAVASPVGVIPAGSVRDEARNKSLELSIEYPTKGGPHPVIVFSHGYGGTSLAYVGISSFWASHGYVVIKPTHADAGKLTGADLADPAKLAAPLTPAEWRDRIQDVRLVIDSLAKLQQQYPELEGKVDATRIGVSGHSYGAFTTMLLAGARTFSSAVPTSYTDPRVKAALVLSPQGVSESRGLTRESWSELRIPTMFVTGSNDRGANEGEDEAWRRQAFELSPAGDKWFVSIVGAGHFTFTGGYRAIPDRDPVSDVPLPRDPRDPRNPGDRTRTPPRSMRDRDAAANVFIRDRNTFNLLKTVTVAFWDTYLKSEPKGREYLTGLSTRGDLTVATK